MLQCNHPTVISFYSEHPQLSFTDMNVLFVNVMRQLLTGTQTSLTNSIGTQLVEQMNQLLAQQRDAKEQWALAKQQFVSDVQRTVIQHHHDTMVPQLRSLLAELEPALVRQLPGGITNAMRGEWSADLAKRVADMSQASVTGIMQRMAAVETGQTETNTSLGQLLKKMENSSTKGKMAENVLSSVLHRLYPTATIASVGDQKGMGDIMLVRVGKPTILIENKDWNKNVPTDEVKKFIRDVEEQHCCGLFLSQNCGIANKGNFEINVSGSNVLMYVHDVRNEAEKIRMAIDIIDHFKVKLDECTSAAAAVTATFGANTGINTTTSTTVAVIDTETLNEINAEYQAFVAQQLLQIRMVREFSQKMVKQIEEVSLPSLKKYLSTRYAFAASAETHICPICGFVGKNAISLSAHRRRKECRGLGTSVGLGLGTSGGSNDEGK
jgi:hypothetical protein